MYNRYIRTDDGGYTRVTEEEASRSRPRQETPDPPGGSPPPPGSSTGGACGSSPFGGADGIAGYLRRVLDQLHLDRIDAGDLLLLGLLYFLFREKADEELLIALGLLLIL